MFARLFARIACAGGCVAVLAAAPHQDQVATPIFHAGTNLARLDVRVTDARGQVISDLRPDEIEIVEAGTRRPVLLFQHVAESGRSYGESGARTIGGEVSTNQ